MDIFNKIKSIIMKKKTERDNLMDNKEYRNARFEISKAYLEGTCDIDKDISYGIELITNLADKNHKDAQFFLAQCYERGDYIYKDPVMAHVYYNLCATSESKERLEELEKYMEGYEIREARARARVKYNFIKQNEIK